jgi:hypothetical protein
MDEMEFVKKYYFDHLKMVTVKNPRSEDYIFGATIEAGVDVATGKLRSEQRTYRVQAGQRERLPGPIANMYLDQMTKLLAQDQDKFRFLIDFALKAQYYDELIVDVIDLIATYQPLPQYLQKTEEEIKEAKEEPFAGRNSDAETSQPKEVKRSVGRPAKVA